MLPRHAWLGTLRTASPYFPISLGLLEGSAEARAEGNTVVVNAGSRANNHGGRQKLTFRPEAFGGEGAP